LGFIGSLDRGFRGPHKGRTAFNVTDFDVDLYVVHVRDFLRFYRRITDAGAKVIGRLIKGERTFILPDAEYTPELKSHSDKVVNALGDVLKREEMIGDVEKFKNESSLVLRGESPTRRRDNT